jgi:hypothetical protein
MYLSGFTTSNPDDSNHHTVVARFNSWSTGNRTAAYVCVMPTDTLQFAQTNRIDSFDVAGGYIFAQSGNSSVHVFDKNTGSSTAVVTLSPGTEVGGYTGANDNYIRVHAFVRSTGDYVVCCEENLYNKVIFYRWNPNGSTQTAATPTFSPGTGTYTSAQTVTLNDSTSGASIYYTTNGTVPTTGSTLYTGPISVSSSETIYAVAVASGYANSTVGSAVYTINTSAGTPVYQINLDGPALTIGGNSWESYSTALSNGFSVSGNYGTWSGTYSFGLSPTTDSNTTSMLESMLYDSSSTSGQGFTMSQTVANGSYNVYLWMIENNQSNSRSANVTVQGTQVATGIGSLPLGTWQEYGPYPATVTNGAVSVGILCNTGNPVCCGLAIYTSGASAPSTPTGLTATAGSNSVSLSWTAPSGTVTGYNIYRGTSAGSEVKLASPSGTGTTYTDSTAANGTTYYYEVTAINGSAEGAKSNEVSATPTAKFVLGINIDGPAETIGGNSWESYSTALSSGFSVSGNYGTWSGTYSFGLSPTTDTSTTTMLESMLYNTSSTNGQGFTMTQTIANGSYSVYVYMIENNQSNSRNANITVQGTQVATGVGSLPLGTWQAYGPYTATVSNGALSVAILADTMGNAVCCGLSVYQ